MKRTTMSKVIFTGDRERGTESGRSYTPIDPL
jgi:hypothetical protein